MTGKMSLNSMLHLQIEMHLRKLFLRSIQVLGNPSYHQPIWKLLLKKNQSRRSIPSMNMPSSIENLGGWQHDWKKRRTPDFCLNKAYKSSIHPNLHNKILFYLHDEKTPHKRGEAFKVKQVREVAEHILAGFGYQYKSSRPSALSKSTTPTPPVKTEFWTS